MQILCKGGYIISDNFTTEVEMVDVFTEPSAGMLSKHDPEGIPIIESRMPVTEASLMSACEEVNVTVESLITEKVTLNKEKDNKQKECIVLEASIEQAKANDSINAILQDTQGLNLASGVDPRFANALNGWLINPASQSVGALKRYLDSLADTIALENPNADVEFIASKLTEKFEEISKYSAAIICEKSDKLKGASLPFSEVMHLVLSSAEKMIEFSKGLKGDSVKSVPGLTRGIINWGGETRLVSEDVLRGYKLIERIVSGNPQVLNAEEIRQIQSYCGTLGINVNPEVWQAVNQCSDDFVTFFDYIPQGQQSNYQVLATKLGIKGDFDLSKAIPTQNVSVLLEAARLAGAYEVMRKAWVVDEKTYTERISTTMQQYVLSHVRNISVPTQSVTSIKKEIINIDSRVQEIDDVLGGTAETLLSNPLVGDRLRQYEERVDAREREHLVKNAELSLSYLRLASSYMAEFPIREDAYRPLMVAFMNVERAANLGVRIDVGGVMPGGLEGWKTMFTLLPSDYKVAREIQAKDMGRVIDQVVVAAKADNMKPFEIRDKLKEYFHGKEIWFLHALASDIEVAAKQIS